MGQAVGWRATDRTRSNAAAHTTTTTGNAQRTRNTRLACDRLARLARRGRSMTTSGSVGSAGAGSRVSAQACSSSAREAVRLPRELRQRDRQVASAVTSKQTRGAGSTIAHAACNYRMSGWIAAAQRGATGRGTARHPSQWPLARTTAHCRHPLLYADRLALQRL